MTEQERCGAKAEGGPCVLPKGHNMGQADIPANHRSERYRSLTNEAWKRLESRVQELEGERERAERDRNNMRHSAYNEQRRAETAESRLARLEEAVSEHERIARHALIEMMDEEDLKRIDTESFPNWTSVAQRRNDERLWAALTHSTPSGRQQLVEACQRAIRRGDKKVAEELDRKINKMDSRAAT